MTELADTTETTPEEVWTRWAVVAASGFEIAGPRGTIALLQDSARDFEVVESFRFTNEAVQADILRQLRDVIEDEAEALERFDQARTYTPGADKRTDLASVPIFLRWFENTYGVHTLAAILHDELIVEQANGGVLRSDTVSDRFFRKMLQASGVPWLKCWVMWAAVAIRSRWAAGGRRRLSLVVWTICALAGITCFVASVMWTGNAAGTPGGALALLLVALVLPVVSAPLWGRQYGASLIAAVAGVFVIPAAVFVLAGLGTYHVIEWLAGVLARRGRR